MRDSVGSDVTKDSRVEMAGAVRKGLYVPLYKPCLFRDRRLEVSGRKKGSLRIGEREAEREVCEIYEGYSNFFSLKEKNNIAVCATEYYSEALRCYFEPVLDKFKKYCKATGQEGLYNKLEKIVSESRLFMLQGLREEIRKNTARYVLRPVSYYVRLAKLRIAHLRGNKKTEEVTHSVQYHKDEISSCKMCEALVSDCTERMECFAKKAQHRYEAYMEVLRLWFGNYGINLPEYADGEEWSIFCHALNRKSKAFRTNGEDGSVQPENKYVSYVPCGCGERTCKTWGTGDEADYELAKWYGMWYGEDGECFELTEETIGGRWYHVKRCYKDVLPQGECTHVEFCCEEAPHELWTMHAGQNLLGLAGEEAKFYYVVLENMERQIMRAYCEEETVFEKQEKHA